MHRLDLLAEILPDILLSDGVCSMNTLQQSLKEDAKWMLPPKTAEGRAANCPVTVSYGSYGILGSSLCSVIQVTNNQEVSAPCCVVDDHLPRVL